MSLNAEELRRHCENILQYRLIKDRIVVLCEGEIQRHIVGPESYKLYKEMEWMPDANFYRACLPRWWREKQPRFFNCGDRQDVLNSYFLLLELHQEDSSKSYLNPEKLFAIVDLDIQSQAIAEFPDYPFPDTEAIFRDLYREGQVNEANAPHHRIWVTGLIHKEAYFISPEVQPAFDNFAIAPVYNEDPVRLDKIYLDMAESISSDRDLENHLEVVSERIGYCSGLNCTSPSKLQ